MKKNSIKKIVRTADGSHTLFVPELNEHYHSVNGAVQESEYIFIKNGLESCTADPVNIFEAGFGTGLNAFLTALKITDSSITVNYTAIEKYPLTGSVIEALNYPLYAGENGVKLFNAIHSAEWGDFYPVSNNFHLRKINLDLISEAITGCYELIYFDAFGPDKQPEMWSKEVFGKISAITAKNGILVTYSAKGEVKRILRQVGFEVSLLPGPPGKRQIIRAVKF
jgi:tRNA U34 5-methylaminomethyl-2-thiouridine-forming methyltransferase MnmC